jgi:hypothetical protein
MAMPISLRLGKGLEKRVNQTARSLHINKSEIIKRSLEKYLSELSETERISLYSLYQRLEDRIPGSGHGSLSMDHRKEVLKRIKSKEK